VKNTPVAGAIAVWQPGADGGVASGHVGYVKSVSASGATFATSEMNDLGVPYKMIYRMLSSVPLAGRTFIYPPAGFRPVVTALDKPAFNQATNGSRAFSDTAKH
jgi:surface antigen